MNEELYKKVIEILKDAQFNYENEQALKLANNNK